MPSIIERAQSGVDASQEPAPTDPVPEGPAEVPLDDGADWIQLKSGEWLRGELLGIRRESLTFDSDELDELDFDLEDVRQVRTPRSDVVLATGNRLFDGRLVIDQDDVWIVGDRTVQLTREELLTLVPIEGGRIAQLRGDLSFGFTARSGNTDQIDYNALVNIVRSTARTRASLRYIGVISDVNDDEVANNHRLTSMLDTQLDDRTFITFPGIELFRDRLQNIAIRATPYAAVGYKVVDTDQQDWRLSIGPAYQYTELQNADAGQDATTESAALFFSSNFDWEITKDVDLDFDYSITMPVPDTDEYNHTLLLGLSVDITNNIDLDVTFIWDRINSPVAGENGVIPEPNDFRTTIGIGWEF
ncbi:MAG: DUF481 domain-containing protein [Planctomycetota bacterium]